jgi:outer membrane protein OmpA-like peptidoglycan-associated protein
MSKFSHVVQGKKLSVFGMSLTITLLLALTPTASQAASADVVDKWYVLNWGKQPKMYQVDKSTGTMTLIAQATQDTGTDGNTGAAGFDVDSTNSVGYFIPYSNSPTSLWKVDLISGQFTNIGTSDAEYVTALDIGNNGDVWVAADSLDGQGQGFGRVNISTGDSTFLAAGPERISALATSANGVLYAFAYNLQIYTVNTTTYAFTQVGTLPSMMRAADIDSSGDIILTDWDGYVSKYDLDTNTTTTLFQALDNNGQRIEVGTEALGVGGPTNGQTLTQAVAEAAAASAPAAVAPAAAPAAVAPTVAASKISASSKIKFDRSSSVLTKASKAKLKKLAKSVGADAEIKVQAAVGPLNNASKAQMRALAKLRAKAIAKYLKSQISMNQTYKIKIIDEGVKPVTSVTAN